MLHWNGTSLVPASRFFLASSSASFARLPASTSLHSASAFVFSSGDTFSAVACRSKHLLRPSPPLSRIPSSSFVAASIDFLNRSPHSFLTSSSLMSLYLQDDSASSIFSPVFSAPSTSFLIRIACFLSLSSCWHFLY